eukprot:jgi/Hompol1/5395/HPOL_004383-RA
MAKTYKASAKVNVNLESYDAVKATIAALQDSIETAERSFKETVMFRKMAPKGIFVNTDEMASLFMDSENTSTWMDRAQKELSRQHDRRIAIDRSKELAVKVIQDRTQGLIQAAKAKTSQRKAMFEARAKFLRHGLCIFGTVIYVAALNDGVIAVFNSANMIEIWAKHHPIDDRSTIEWKVEKLIDISCPGDSVTYVKELYSGDMNPNPQSSKQTASHTKTTDGVLSLSNDLFASAAPSRRTSGAATGVSQRTEIQPPLPRRVTRLDELQQVDTSNLEDLKHVLSPEDLELFTAHVNSFRFHTVFFIGLKSGEAILMEIIWEFNIQTREKKYSTNILSRKRISYIPITCVHYQHPEDETPLLITEICTITGEHVLQAFRTNFEIEWACKCEMLKLTSIDHKHRVIPQDRMEFAGKRLTDFKAVAICDDLQFQGLVIALRSGTLARVSYDRESLLDAIFSNQKVLFKNKIARNQSRMGRDLDLDLDQGQY